MKSILVKMYVEEELAQEINLIIDGDNPNPLGLALQEGMNSHILYNDLENIPSKGMTYGDEQFSNGPDGETFISNSTATDRSYELFVFLKDNKVIGHWLLPNEHPIFEITSAVLKSSPRFEIVE
jgi:hypothetical protein